MISKKSVKAYLVLLGLLTLCTQSTALEICSQEQCTKVEQSNLIEITEKLNRIFTFLEAGDYIQLCKSNSAMTQCTTSDIGYLILGGFVLPMRGKITGYKVERIEDKISLIADAGKSTCNKSDLIFRTQNDSITLMNSSSYYCNWLGVGNVMSYTELKLKKIDWDNLQFYGDYKVTAVGTAIGSGEGVGSFQVRRGKSVLTSAQQKHNDLQFFYGNQKAKLNKISSSEPTEIRKAQEDSEQAANIVVVDPLPSQSDITKTSGDTKNPVALKDLDGKNSEASIPNSKGLVAGEKKIATEKARDEPLTAEKARDERLTAEKARAERLAAEKSRAEKLAAEKSRAEKLAAEKARAERLAAEKARTERIAADKLQAEKIAMEKAQAEQLTVDNARAEKKANEKEESVRIAPSAPAKNDGKTTRPTVNRIMDL